MIILGVLGAAFGSFACCQAWRVRKHDKSPRSHCMNCKYQLKWYDNIPVLSWLLLGGKCRKCHKKIGVAEILSEVGLAAIFVLSYALWPLKCELFSNAFETAKFALFLGELVLFAILFVYDARWKEMPTAVLIAGCVIGVLFFGTAIAKTWYYWGLSGEMFMSILGALLILPGFYFLLYKASKETWVGSGDAILCIPLALMLGNFWLAMFCLFLSNMIGSVIMLPVTIAKKKKHAMIPFGPFLIVGFWIVYFFQSYFLDFVSGL